MTNFLAKAQPILNVSDPIRPPPSMRKQRRDAESSIETLPGLYRNGSAPKRSDPSDAEANRNSESGPVAAIIENRLKKQELLDDLNNRVDQLQLEREKVQNFVFFQFVLEVLEMFPWKSSRLISI